MNEDYIITPERVYSVTKTTLENNVEYFKSAAIWGFNIFFDVPSVKYGAENCAKKCQDFEFDLPGVNDEMIESRLRHSKEEFNDFADEATRRLRYLVREDFDEVDKNSKEKAEAYLTDLITTKDATDLLFNRMTQCTKEFSL